jgi:hypothetical protein
VAVEGRNFFEPVNKINLDNSNAKVFSITILSSSIKTALSEPQFSLEDSATWHPFSLLWILTIFLFFTGRHTALHPIPNLENQVPVLMSPQ